MSADIQWGAEIAVNGVRPEWLRDEDKFRWFGPGMGQVWYDAYLSPNDSTSGAMFCKGAWPKVTAIRLSADHPYYLATSRGFTYWPGGESAPDDWDGGEVLLRDGDDDGVGDCWSWDGVESDIIGYRKRTEQPAPAIGPALVERMRKLVLDVATDDRISLTAMQTEARDILKALEPVDEDLAEARNIACENSRWDRGNCFWKEVQQGKSDHIPMVQAALAAIKRGRELERERGEAGR